MTLPGPKCLTKYFNYEYGYQALEIGRLLAVSTLLIGVSGLSHAQSTDNYKTIYKSTGKFGEVKYSQFEPDAGIESEIIQMRSDGRQSQPGLFATTDVYQIPTHQSSNNQSPSSRSSTPPRHINVRLEEPGIGDLLAQLKSYPVKKFITPLT